MNQFKIVFEEAELGELELAMVSAFSFNIDIHNLYATSKVILKDLSKRIFNKISIGQKVTVIFYDAQETVNKKSLTSEMRVLSFQKVMGSARDIIDRIEISLISSWYFEAEPKTLRYFGTVSQITREILERDFNKLGFTFNISSTSDIAKPRYQLSERSQDFLKRILKYGFLGNLPIYLYTDANSQICLRGILEFINQATFITVTPLEGLVATEDLKSEKSQLTRALSLRDYKLLSDVTQSASKIDSIFTTAHFATSDEIVESFSLNSAESTNDINAKINAQVKKASQPKTRYVGWNLNPQDALAITTKESFEKINTAFQLLGLMDGYVTDSFTLGTLLRLELPFEKVKNTTTGEDVNLGEGGYLITSIKYTYQDSIPQTTFLASQVKY